MRNPKENTPIAPDGLAHIGVEYHSTLNYAFQLNGIPFIHSIQVHNRSEQDLDAISVRVWGEPSPAPSWETRIERIPAHSTYNLDQISMRFSPDRLLALRERESGLLFIETKQGDALLAKESYDYELLAYNEWCGLQSLPEILAAYVLPNSAGVDSILPRTRDEMRRLAGDASLSGYQSRDPARALHMAEAAYAAIVELGVSYINPPASFERTGQKVRLPDVIVRDKMGTCLDLALFYAAILEQAGLFPLVVLLKDHAFTAVWLEEDYFSEAYVEDAVRLRKRIRLSRMIAVEITGATQGMPFQEAMRKGQRLLEADELFRAAIDVHAARQRRILPISLPGEAPSPATPASPSSIPAMLASETTAKPTTEPMTKPMTKPLSSRGEPSPAFDSLSPIPVAPREDPPARIERWKRKLLDLSLRNRLLNFKETKKTCPLLCPDINRLEDALADGAQFKLFCREELRFDQDPRLPEFQSTGENQLESFLLEEMDRRRLYSSLDDNELEKRLLEIFREARVSMEEGGANTLYLALGFLKWYESSHSDTAREAPILLVPLIIERPSVRHGFRIRMLEEDPRINVTLLQKLRLDFGLEIDDLDPLPMDESGVDVKQVVNTIRLSLQGVRRRDVERWEVVDRACIGHFTFARYLLWHELENGLETLLENPVVRHLVQRPQHSYDDGVAFPNHERLDDDYPPDQVFCVTDADSSQLAAVLAAANGKSFVLQGPPGTGKSQTITNMVAQCLAEEKTVLFVSAKIAALNVVYDRLHKLGLGPFCLELHSNKAEKKRVLEQLQRAFEANAIPPGEEWPRTAAEIQRLRQELNQYVRLMHTPRAHGATPYQIISHLIGCDSAPCPELDWTPDGEASPEQRREAEETVDRLQHAAAPLGVLEEHPWRASDLEAWSPALERRIPEWTREGLSLLDRLGESLHHFTAHIPLDVERWSQEKWDAFHQLASLALEAPHPTEALLNAPQWPLLREQVQSWIDLGRRRDQRRSEALAIFHERILNADVSAAAERLERARNSNLFVSWFHVWQARRMLKSFANGTKLPKKDELRQRVASAIAAQDEQRQLMRHEAEAVQLLGAHWRVGEADWDALEHLVDWADSFRKALAALPPEQTAIWIGWAVERDDRLGDNAPVGRNLRAILEHLETLNALQNTMQNELRLDAALAWGETVQPERLPRLRQQLETWKNRYADLHPWCGYVQARNRARQHGLSDLVRRLEQGELTTHPLREAHNHAFHRWAFERLMEREPALAGFQSHMQERFIQRFAQYDRNQMELARSEVASRVRSRIPDLYAAHDESVIGILRREFNRRARHKPIRKLFSETKTLLPRIKPCFLMSPLSAAQYLDWEFPKFDVVIFDEASQLPTWEAVGVMARGQQVIVVGDSRQLPPTNFFDRMDHEDDLDDFDEDDVQDLESVLDECEAAGLPPLLLRWHYRSRHEHLIAFSNHHYYENRLITFPSAMEQAPHLGVHFIDCKGVYDRGGSRTNRAEADAIANEIVRRLDDERLRQFSIGVVTFNQAQQFLIEDLLDQARRERPELDRFFGDVPEPVIVKNLENVQGDERDVIFFSITYGPDAQGRVSRNFGPMNKQGGERRLNVAVTRARRQVMVYSSLRADQIDLRGLNSTGSRHLRTYLDYAERGPRAIAEAIELEGLNEFDSPFERDVHRELTTRGWQVDAQVGCSGYRVDLAVRHPEAPGRYLLGIECDGAMYHSAKSARDRDRIRQAVLEGLGWTLHRIWSTDWRLNKRRELDKLETRLRELQSQPIDAIQPFVDPPASEKAPTNLPDQSTDGENGESASHRTSDAQPHQLIARAIPVESVSQPTSPSPKNAYMYYEDTREYGDGEAFYQSASKSRIGETLIEIVRVEGPIEFKRAGRLAAAHWGLSRMTRRVEGRIREALPRDAIRIENDRDHLEFLWPAELQPNDYGACRAHSPEEATKRRIDEIPTCEIANAAATILKSQIELPVADLIAETARFFGIQRVTGNIGGAIQAGVNALLQRGDAIKDGIRIRVP